MYYVITRFSKYHMEEEEILFLSNRSGGECFVRSDAWFRNMDLSYFKRFGYGRLGNFNIRNNPNLVWMLRRSSLKCHVFLGFDLLSSRLSINYLRLSLLILLFVWSWARLYWVHVDCLRSNIAFFFKKSLFGISRRRLSVIHKAVLLPTRLDLSGACLLPPQGFSPEAKTRGGIIETPA